MNEMYAEAGVKRKGTIKTMAIRVLLIIAVVISFFLTFISSFMVVIAAAFIVLVIYLYPRLNVEYEYVFCDGQLDFDKIMGNAKRKNVMKIDLEQAQIVAIEGSHELDSYNNKPGLKIKDFSSLRPGVKPYIIITQSGENTVKIIFEPSEKMIKCMKQKAPRKIITY